MQNIRYIGFNPEDDFRLPGWEIYFRVYDTDNTRSPQPSISLIQGFSFDGQRGVKVTEDRRSKS